MRLMNHFREQAGVSLVEVMVALFTTSVGLLGLAAMQTKSLQFNQSAYMRTQATILANDLIDRMRGNSVGSSNYEITLADDPAVPPVNCLAAPCTPVELATFDLNQWVDTLETQLPEGDGAVQDLGNNLYRVSISWSDRDNQTRVFSMEARL